MPAYVENAYELLDQPGQWYLDQAAHTVSYIPRQGENLRWADVEAPVLQALVTGQGTAAAPVHDITFTGIQFSYATWLTPSTPEGFSEIQANYTITGDAGYATQGLCQFVPGHLPIRRLDQDARQPQLRLRPNIHFTSDLRASRRGRPGSGQRFAARPRPGACSPTSPATASRSAAWTCRTGHPGRHTTGVQVLDNHLYDLPVEYHGGVAIDVGYADSTFETTRSTTRPTPASPSAGAAGRTRSCPPRRTTPTATS